MSTKTVDSNQPILSQPLRLERIHIENYKGFDTLDVEFPRARFEGDPDIAVIGSRNGLGKTSLLECCALLLYSLSRKDFLKVVSKQQRTRLRLPFERDFFISGDIFSDDDAFRYSRSATKGLFDVPEYASNSAFFPYSLSYKKKMFVIPKTTKMIWEMRLPGESKNNFDDNDSLGQVPNGINSIVGYNPNPILENDFLHFNSYRKIQESALELRMLVRTPQDPLSSQRFPLSTISSFKIHIYRAVTHDKKEYFKTYFNPEEILKFLNTLLDQYADVEFKEFDEKPDETIEIILKHKKTLQEFSFDGLSSGQKEIISTLFLIWFFTQNAPKIVLIDEPELHLNRDWQQTFVRDLVRIAPQNQYILATHSVEIADSVDSYQRILLQ